MLNLTVKPGEYFVIGDDIRVIFAGGTANNARVMIDAPRSYNIVRGKVLEQSDGKSYYVEPELSGEQIKSFQRQQERQRQQNRKLQQSEKPQQRNQKVSAG